MIKIQPNTDITPELVGKIIERFLKEELPRLQQLEKYYHAENDILKRKMDTGKPNNRIAHGFARYITNMATGYFMGEGIRHELDDEEFKKRLTGVLSQNNTKDIAFEVAKEMSKKGIAFELLYMDENGDIRFRKFDGESFIPVYSTSVGEFLEFAIRIWQEEDIITGEAISYAEVYTKTELITYRKEQDKYREIERDFHLFNDVPVIVYWNNAEQKGDYEDVITLIDAYDKAQSDTANDFEYFTDAYLVIVGAAGGIVKVDGNSDEEGDAIRTLRQERVLLLDEKGQAEWLIKQINDTAVENYKNRIYNDLFFLAQVPALTDESFAGNLSGVAIRYKLIGLEQLATIKENKFLAAYRKKLRLITEQLNKKYNRQFNADEVEIIFDRNMIHNMMEAATIAATLNGITSRETLLSTLPFVQDVKEEMEKIRKEQEEEDALGRLDEELVASLGDE